MKPLTQAKVRLLQRDVENTCKNNRGTMEPSTTDTEANSMASSPEKQEELPDWAVDPANAQNWSLTKKLYNTSVPSLRSFGPMIAAPLSETFGRRFVYIIMTPLALLFILGAGFAHNFATLAICRLLGGILCSAPLAVGAGTIMDTWTGQNTNRGVVVLMGIAFLGPALGSLVGGWIAEYKDFRWSQWTTLFLGAALWVYSMGAQETYAIPIRRRLAKKMGLPPPPKPIPDGLAGVRMLMTVTLARPLYMLITEPIVTLCSLYSSLNFSVLFCFLASVPLIYSTNYGFSPGQSGLAFIGIAVGCIIGAVALIILDGYTMAKHRARQPGAAAPPERMLVAAMVSTMLYLTNVYGAKFGASALAANGLLRYSVGGSFPLFTIPMYNNLGFTWASSLLGFLAIAFAPLPWIFYRFGKKIRQSSAYTA
ncbi:hypothetical protein APSETT444_010512 [Aspergillus pseudonomiae]